ncbi:MAG: hypothetical protein U0835_26105 [Isosphaeraceae bacterium]
MGVVYQERHLRLNRLVALKRILGGHADPDGDGVQELVVRNAGDGTLTILAGNGDGPLASEGLRPSIGLGTFPGVSDLMVRDLNGPGPDLLVTGRGSGGEEEAGDGEENASPPNRPRP